MVAVTGERDLDALEWAAAEAASIGAPLCVVHPILGPSWQQHRAGIEADGCRLLEWALLRVNEVAPEVAATGRQAPGSPVEALASESVDAHLLVVSRSCTQRTWWRAADQSAWRRLVEASGVPVVVTQLRGDDAGRPGAGVMVVLGPRQEVSATLDAAFEAAQRRGVGVTIMLVPESSAHSRARPVTVSLTADSVATRVNTGRVDLQCARGSNAPHGFSAEQALALGARGAALVVIGVGGCEPDHRWTWHGPLLDRVLVGAAGPVMLVPAREH